VLSTDLTDGAVATVQGEEVTVDLSDGVVLNGSANVVIADVPASNGVIHAIDGVIVPPSIDVEAFLETCPA
jgi:transforming growth factor-beta-induced protein